ncbi:MAG: ABC transporter ATP-binding protein [Lachnospiraceae bacterium]|nr:ABC transporter ATP-binding protein [Lachnospiraceae bacterium]
MSKLNVENVSVTFDDKKIIENISLELKDGEIVSLLGVSGAGKTTLFNVIAGLVTPETGKVYLEGEDITGKTGKVSYMLQKDLMLPFKTIVDNVSLPLVVRGEKKKQARETASKYFEEFGLKGCEKMYPDQLSGGMRQRAAFLRTYLFSDNVALLDEPFSALDTITKSDMHKWYLNVMEQIKLSTVFITHDIDEAIKLSDRIYIMTGKPGKITKEIIVNTPKPRDKAFALSDEFVAYKREIMEYLEKNI